MKSLRIAMSSDNLIRFKMKKTNLNFEAYKIESKSLNKIYGGIYVGGNTPDTESEKDKKMVADDCEAIKDTIRVIKILDLPV